MVSRKFRRIIAFLVIFQMIGFPLAAAAQQTDAEITTMKSLADLKKAQADADKAKADASKQEIENFKTQLEMAKSSTSTQGTLIENNIAASKAVGCATEDIAIQVNRLNSSGQYNKLIVYGQAAVNGLSDYAGIKLQIDRMNSTYDHVNVRLKSKLDVWDNKLEQNAKARANISKAQSNTKTGFVWNLPDGVNSSYKTNLIMDYNNDLGLKSLGAGIVNPVLGAALSILPLFKTDTTLTGYTAPQDDAAFRGYLYRSLRRVASKNINVISPDNMVFTGTSGQSVLLSVIDDLSKKYSEGKMIAKRAAAVRKAVQEDKEIDLDKPDADESAELTALTLENALRSLAEKPNDPVRMRNYTTAKKADQAAIARVAYITKAAANSLGDFDRDIASDLAIIESQNINAETLSGRFTGKDAQQRQLGDILKYEQLYENIATDPHKVLWLDAKLSTSGANQRIRSNIFTDIVTHGPAVDYSGGAVISYQLLSSDGTVVDSGTTWSYLPYKKSKKLAIYDCNGASTGNQPPRYVTP